MQFSFHAAVATSSSIWIIGENDQLPRPHQLDNICIYNQLNEKQYLLFLIYLEIYYLAEIQANMTTKLHC